MQCGQKASLAGKLAHGTQQREVAILVRHVLISYGRNMAVQQTVGLCGMGIGVNIGEQNLILVHPLELFGKQFFDLIDQLRLFPDGVLFSDDGSCCLIIAVGVTAADTGAGFDVNGVAMAHDLGHSGGDGGNTVLIGLDFL